MPEDADAPPPGRRPRLTVRNAGPAVVRVSLDPWGAHADVERGGWITLWFDVPPGQWLQLDLTAAVVFLNGWRGSGCVYELVDAAGDARVVRLPAPAAPPEPGPTGPEPYASWARRLEPTSWRALLFAEVPLVINGVVHVGQNASPQAAHHVLASTKGPDDGSVTVSVEPTRTVLTSASPLDVATHP